MYVCLLTKNVRMAEEVSITIYIIEVGIYRDEILA